MCGKAGQQCRSWREKLSVEERALSHPCGAGLHASPHNIRTPKKKTSGICSSGISHNGTTSGLSSRKHSKAKSTLMRQLAKHCWAPLKLLLSTVMVINNQASSQQLYKANLQCFVGPLNSCSLV